LSNSSIDTARAAIKLAISDREEEKRLKKLYLEKGIFTGAVDFGGSFNNSITSIIENTVVAARKENIIKSSHVHQGAVAGAVHDAIKQVMSHANGLNVGGKIGIARSGEHLVVTVFFGVGMLNLNEVAIGLSHRSIDY
jgi:hypothetical protein